MIKNSGQKEDFWSVFILFGGPSLKNLYYIYNLLYGYSQTHIFMKNKRIHLGYISWL